MKPASYSRAKRLTFILLSVLSVNSLAAEENPCLRRTIPVHVLDSEGKPVSGLRAENFRAEYRGKPVQILRVEADISARRILLLLDASGSMTAGAMWQGEQALAADLVRFAPQSSSLALMVFASEVEDKVGFAQGPLAVAKRLEVLRAEREPAPSGHRKTALYDAILAGIAELKPARFGDAVYVITRGGDNGSQSKPSDVGRALVTQGVRLFVFLFNDLPARERTPQEATAPAVLRGLVEKSGGALSMFARDFGRQGEFSQMELVDIVAAARPLYKAMGQLYRLEIDLPEEVDKPRHWKLGVFTQRGKRRQQLLALYPELFPCDVGHKHAN